MGPDAITSILLRGLAVFALVAANAFFVAAEFALVAARQTRLAALVKAGDHKAKLAQKAKQSLDKYISACQLGITLASLALGWIGEPAVAGVLHQVFGSLPIPFAWLASETVSFALAFSFITVLHIVYGELAPKTIALLHPETTSRWVAPPLVMFTIATNPFIRLLNWSANATLRLFRIHAQAEHDRVHQPDEIVMLVKRTQESGRLAHGDVRMIEGVFEFSEKVAREVMTPRTEVIGLPIDTTIEQAAVKMAEIGRSRYPVYEGSLDNILGIVNVKQVLASIANAKYQTVGAIMGEPLFIPGPREVEDVLTDMQRIKQHMAIVLDEYGGTAGIVTMEDLLEEIVGSIYDEFDAPTLDDPSTAGSTTVAGNMDVDDANEQFGFEITTGQYQTVGGYVFSTLGRLPAPGDRVPVKEGFIEVLEMDGLRVSKLRIRTAKPPRGR